MKKVVVTGASSGIGKATCKKLIESGYFVFGSVRKKTDGDKLQNELGVNFTPLVFDVKNLSEIKIATKVVREKLSGQCLTALINNAGIAVIGPLQYLPIEDFREQVEVKLFGTLACVQAFLPLLGADQSLKGPRGRIINISSALGGKIGAPFFGAYCSSKHALEAMSETLRRELMLHGVKVSIIAPGAIATPIWDKVNPNLEQQKYKHTEYSEPLDKALALIQKLGKSGLPVETVASKIKTAVEAKNPKIKYYFFGEILLMLIYFLPAKFLVTQFSKYFGLKKD